MNSTDHAAHSNNVDGARPQTMVDIAYASIVAGIVSRRYQGGDFILEAKIAQGLGLSRTPVREAIGRLEGEGLLVKTGRAMTVKRVSVQEYLEALHLRRLVEEETVGLACGSIAMHILKALRGRVAALEDPALISADEHWAIDNDIHQTIANASGNESMARLIADLRIKTRLFNLKRVPNRFLPGRDEHLAIIDALIAEDEHEARHAMRTHLNNVKASILAILGV